MTNRRISQDFPDMTLVGEEDAEALTEGGEGGAATLAKIVALVNKTLKTHIGDDAVELSSQDVVSAIKERVRAGQRASIGFWIRWTGRSVSCEVISTPSRWR